MIFAEDEETFYTLLDTMQNKVNSLGYEEVLAVDMQNAQAQNEARQRALALYGNEEALGN